jgi:hypothetical protein
MHSLHEIEAGRKPKEFSLGAAADAYASYRRVLRLRAIPFS